MKNPPKQFIIPFFILSFLGFLDTLYLTIIHYKNIIPPCSIAHGCETVLTSKFSTLGGVPIQIPGIIFYLTLMVLLVLFIQTGNKYYFRMLGLIVSAGMGVSIILFGLQAFVIHAFCQYCLASEVIILILTILAVMELKRMNKSSNASINK